MAFLEMPFQHFFFFFFLKNTKSASDPSVLSPDQNLTSKVIPIFSYCRI